MIGDIYVSALSKNSIHSEKAGALRWFRRYILLSDMVREGHLNNTGSGLIIWL